VPDSDTITIREFASRVGVTRGVVDRVLERDGAPSPLGLGANAHYVYERAALEAFWMAHEAEVPRAPRPAPKHTRESIISYLRARIERGESVKAHVIQREQPSIYHAALSLGGFRELRAEAGYVAPAKNPEANTQHLT
jgi:predicted DNA-binding transcriptional regulator AlpA